MASSEVTAYFSWKKFPGNRIYKQTEDLKSCLGDRWDSLSSTEQEELLDDLFVDTEIRRNYKNDELDCDFPPSFPKLMIPSGEKIMVDENDLRTWRDAHSGPFSWKSKSQQDLTLSDFEPENLYKPPIKTKKPKSGNSESETEEAVKENTAPAQFVFSEGRWTSDILSEYHTYLDTCTSKPASRASSPLEEDNPAFEGSVQDLRGGRGASEGSESIVSDQSRSERSVSMVSEVNESPAKSETSEKSKRTKSPGPKKVTFSKSFPKEDNDEDSAEKLIRKETKEESKNAFCNPVMANEWSTFVGQQTEEPVEHVEVSAPVQVTSEPASMTMDRGTESSDHSVESTPDHNAKLLPTPPDLDKAEQEEVLFVAVETEAVRDTASLRKSGFDFLDDW